MKSLPPELDLYTDLSSTPFPGGFPCQVVKPRQGVKYVSDEYCADFRRRAVCFDCGRGKRQERLRAEASGILAKIIKKENGNMATKRGTCGYCEREDMAIVARGLCANCYQKQNRGTLPPKVATVAKSEPMTRPQPELVKGVQGETAEPRLPGECLGGLYPTEDAKSLVDEERKVIGEITMTLGELKSMPLTPLQQECADELAAELASHMQPDAELSWDDFDLVPAPVLDRPCLVSIGNMIDRVCLNSTLQRALGWKKGDRVEVRLSRKSNALAIKLASPDAPRAFTVTSGGKSSVLAVACKTALKILDAQAGKYQVTVADWGLTVWLDRPEEKAA